MADAGLNKASDYKVTKMQLITSDGVSIDLMGLLVETSIYSDIFSSVLTGTIYVTDGKDVLSTLNLHGNEYLRFAIDKPSLDAPIERLFRIYKVSKREGNVGSDIAQNYMLHFCSDELILSLSMSLSKSYKQMKYSDMIIDICQNVLQIPEFDPDYIDDTLGNYDIIIPNLRPLEAINWLASRCYGEGMDNYFFFETFYGYELSSIQTLFNNKDGNKAAYLFDNKRLNSQPINDSSALNEIKIVNGFDTITMKTNGAYASKLLTIDIVNQKQNTYTYSITDLESQNLMMNPYKILNNYTDRNKQTQYENYDAYFRTVTTFNEDIDKYMMSRNMHMALMNNFKLRFSVPGDININAGDMVTIKFPIYEPGDGSSPKQYNEYLTADYLITSLRHIFNQTSGHTSFAEVALDSFNKALPASVAPEKLRTSRT
jgi:hypothetical protein